MKVLLVNGSPHEKGCTNMALSRPENFELKPGAVVVSARRAGTTATLDQMNKYLLYAQMPVVSSRYWNMVHGQTPDQVLEDREGVQIMQVLRKNMAWLLKCIEAGKQEGVSRPKEEKRINTNYIR